MMRLEIIGNVGGDAVVKDLGTNQVINFNVAVTEKYKEETKTTWFEVAKWGNTTTIAQYIKKGDKIFIAGKPNNRSWVNEQGESVTVNGIIAFEIELLGSANKPQQEQSQPAASAQDVNQQFNEEDDDIPF